MAKGGRKVKVKFLGENGFDSELRDALKVFEVGQVLEVEALIIDANCDRSDVEFKGYSGMYNSVMFCVVDSKDIPKHTISCYPRHFNEENLFHVFAQNEGFSVEYKKS